MMPEKSLLRHHEQAVLVELAGHVDLGGRSLAAKAAFAHPREAVDRYEHAGSAPARERDLAANGRVAGRVMRGVDEVAACIEGHGAAALEVAHLETQGSVRARREGRP